MNLRTKATTSARQELQHVIGNKENEMDLRNVRCNKTLSLNISSVCSCIYLAGCWKLQRYEGSFIVHSL